MHARCIVLLTTKGIWCARRNEIVIKKSDHHFRKHETIVLDVQKINEKKDLEILLKNEVRT